MVTLDGTGLVFLVSLPRSGSTLTSLVLGGHSEILCPPEPWFMLQLAVAREPGFGMAKYGMQLAGDATRTFLPYETFLSASRAFACTTYNDFLQQAGKSIFVDKTPRYAYILPFLYDVFPRARFLWLQRNPLDVAASFVSTWGYSVRELVGQRLCPASFDFLEGLFNIIAFFSAGRPGTTLIRYEDVIMRPEESVEKLCCNLNLPYQASMLSYASNTSLRGMHERSPYGDKKVLETDGIHDNSLNQWRRVLRKREVQALLDVLGPHPFDIMGFEETLRVLEREGYVIPSRGEAKRARDRLLRFTAETSPLFVKESVAARRSYRRYWPC